MELEKGIYDQVVNEDVRKGIDGLSSKRVQTKAMDPSSSPVVLSQYIKDVTRKVLEEKKLPAQIETANRIISVLDEESENDVSSYSIDSSSTTLTEVIDEKSPVLSDKRPISSLVLSRLFSGDSELPLVQELKREILTSDRIDMLVSFLRVTGVAMIRNELNLFSSRGGKLRLICTTYMGATEARAVKEISLLTGAKVKISYDTKHTRLHAKAYIFHRNTGFDTAYIGSSNLSKAAISDGKEWNVKITSHDQSDVFDRMRETFETYWVSDEFESFVPSDSEKLEAAIQSEKGKSGTTVSSYSFDIRPYPFQEAILDKLEAERSLFGHTRNLVVAATGTGKTVISAFDYKRFRDANPGKMNSLLFVAHRKEILEQSLSCFRGVLKNQYFGSIYSGYSRPEQTNYLFATIQTIGKEENLQRFNRDQFDFIIVDEFHHAVASSYEKLLSYFKPRILLGLTATPERMDGKDILKFFDGKRFAAEIRLPEAIDRELLVPFHYYGVRDTVDLDSLKWSVGGYSDNDLENEYVLKTEAARKRASMIIGSIEKYLGSPEDVKCLGFCVSVSHASFMADFFNDHGLKAISLSGESDDEERERARRRIANGEINFIFTVNLYNEGVDIPEINTVMFLRPTQSLTVFLQQLGRGLRTCSGKEFLTVLDFIGQNNKKYRFEEKFKALMKKTRRSVTDEISEGFISVPSGCYVELEKDVKNIVLSNIRDTLGNRSAILEKIRSFNEDNGEGMLSLSSFLDYYAMDPRELYKYGSFSALKESAGITKGFMANAVMEDAMKRLSAVDSVRWMQFITEVISNDEITEEDLGEEEKKMADMLLFTVYKKNIASLKAFDVIRDIRKKKEYRDEIVELFEWKRGRASFVPITIPSLPLDVFCSYTRNQVLSAFGDKNPDSWQAGVKYFENENTDVFFITLNKAKGKFTPTTMYRDYAMSPERFHWESQNSTSDNTAVGQRYINGTSRVLLFVREATDDQFGTSQYTFLGPAEYESHKGNKPMAIVWKMKYRIPGRFITSLSRGLAI